MRPSPALTSRPAGGARRWARLGLRGRKRRGGSRGGGSGRGSGSGRRRECPRPAPRALSPGGERPGEGGGRAGRIGAGSDVGPRPGGGRGGPGRRVRPRLRPRGAPRACARGGDSARWCPGPRPGGRWACSRPAARRPLPPRPRAAPGVATPARCSRTRRAPQPCAPCTRGSGGAGDGLSPGRGGAGGGEE